MNKMCPICNRPFLSDPKLGYVLDGARTSTCELCHGTLMQITLQSKLGMRRAFWKARSAEAMRKKIHQAVLNSNPR